MCICGNSLTVEFDKGKCVTATDKGIRSLERCCKLREDEALQRFLSKNPGIVKRNAIAFALNAIVDFRRRRRHELFFLEYLGNY